MGLSLHIALTIGFRPISTSPPVEEGDALLLEIGDFLLLENSDNLLLEA